MTQIIEANYYVYIKLADDGTVLYVGKGLNNREFGVKNESFEWYASKHPVTSKRVAANMTEQEAFTLEAQLIAKHSPHFNRTMGLTAGKWVDADFAKFMDSLTVRQAAAAGAKSSTPVAVSSCFAKAVLKAQSIMLVGDRYSVMLEQLLGFGYTGKIHVLLEQGNGNMGKFEEICDNYGQSSEDVDIYDADNFLSAKHLPKVDYVLMNPPFTNGKSPIWKSFLDKAMTLATKTVYTLMPKRGALDLEHTVLLDTVKFDSTPILGQAVCIQVSATTITAKAEQFKFKLSSNFSEVRKSLRGGYIPAKFIGISRNKRESNCQLRSAMSLAEASMCVIHGPDIELVALLAAKHNFEARVVQFKADKAKNFGHAPSLTKQELVMLFNQLYDMEFNV